MKVKILTKTEVYNDQFDLIVFTQFRLTIMLTFIFLSDINPTALFSKSKTSTLICMGVYYANFENS